MRFGVLGPLAVWAGDGRPVRIPELKVRALLADLLAHEGRVVSADRLIEDVWSGDRLPRNPSGTLQTRVSQLRRALEEAEPGARDLIVSQRPGYLLRVDGVAVDAGRFRALVARARDADDPGAQAALLRDALALWRGPAYADFADAEFARPAIARLDEERLVAEEERAEARLALGEHGALAGELAGLVAGNPLRERLRAVHMRALYRAGRQGDALAGYADLRERLAEDLGLSPGPESAALYEAILKQDPDLDPVPPPAPVRPRTNLPAPVTELIGRADATGQVRALLESGRLVTLTGPGGVGKTSLALETARAASAGTVAGGFEDGAWLVELAGLDRERAALPEVVETVAATLGVRDDAPPAGIRSGPVEPLQQLADALRAKRLLLVLDNCEHVVEPVAELAGHLLGAAPGLRILATGQEPLGISGERLWPVPPLGPSDAGRLFTARVAAAVPGYEPGPDDADAVAAICRRLDGLPLALELAAARVRALGVHALAERLDDRFRVLVAGRRDAPARQRTLRAMIDWSWEPLSGPERTVLRRLAVHAEGCTLEAAEEVCAGDGLDVVDLLARLVDRSLVVRTEGGRYRLLESVRAYGLERLREAGEHDAIRLRHLRHHAGLAVRAERHLYGHDQRRHLERLDAETANLRAALDTAVTSGAGGDALRMVNALAWYWFLRGRLTEARRSLDLALSIPGGPERERARAAVWRAGFALLGCDGTDPRAKDEVDLVSRGDLPDPGLRAWAQWFLGFTHRGFGDLAVTADLVERALAGFRAQRDRWGTAAALSVRATIRRAHADLAAARADAEESRALFLGLGDRWGGIKAANTLAELAEIAGDYERAAGLHRDGLRMAEELHLWTEASFTLAGLGRIHLLAGDLDAADDHHRRAMRLAAGQSNRVAEHFAEVGLALAARRRGELDRAEAHLAKWVGWVRMVNGEPGLALVLAELGFVAELRGDAAAALSLHRDGLASARQIGDPRAVALALEGIAGARVIEGAPAAAARLLGTASALRSSVGAPLPSAECADVDRITAAARAALGGAAFEAEFQQGTRTPPDQADLPA
ncbi:BTAD domain-containing putative transcriptional regulator [Actinomadura rubrisoli]|uniref:AfsR/SARP family transcriptional regulator n=1 Tax=Actinomadura rubrisoli TaxID=2530368 RepID=A0A4R5AIK4_9ACTN|nr:BTAD domain-containing putative transcriptional regulator [Actinomadura rubrisoli]TDD71199.1 AfsR/SARP family transcriptional regulator [Actinomadura rubrisoli]